MQLGSSEPRLLHVRSEHGYTDRPDRALRDEPEAVSEREQRLLTDRARLVDAERGRDRWRASYAVLVSELAELGGVRFDVDVSSDLRAIERLADRINRKLRA